MSIDLGSERKLLTDAFGDDIEERLNNPYDLNTAIAIARVFLISDPKNHHVVGSRIALGMGADDVRGKINEQIGHPPHWGWPPIKEFLAGKENDYLTIVLGYNNLPLIEKIKLRLGLWRSGIKTVVDE